MNNVNNNGNNPNLAFKNPLELSGRYDPNTHSRVQVDMPKADKDFFCSIRPTKNTMQTVINYLLVKLQNELKSRNITTVIEQQEFCDYVRCCRISDGRDENGTIAGSTPNRPVSEASAPDDNGRKAKAPRKGAQPKK